MNKTVLLLDQKMNNMIKGSKWKNLAWRDLTFSHSKGQTTKGVVVEVGGATMTLEVPSGFPTPQKSCNTGTLACGLIRGCTCCSTRRPPPGSALTPAKITNYADVNHTVHKVLPTYNAHLPYHCSLNAQPKHNGSAYVCDAVKDLGHGRWQFTLRASAWANLKNFYQKAIGNKHIVVGIKAKRGGQAYALSEGDGIKFERVRWSGHSRGIVKNSNNVLFKDTDVSPMPPPVQGQGYTTASNGGGPQIHGAVDNVVISGHTSQSSGDDSLAFFDIKSGSVTNCIINDGWGAGILLSNVSSAFDKNVYNNTVRRTPIYYPES